MQVEEIKEIKKMLNNSLSKLDEIYETIPEKNLDHKNKLQNIIGQTAIYLNFINDCLSDEVDKNSKEIDTLVGIIREHCRAVLGK